MIRLFRMVHIENIAHIREYGITHLKSPHCNPNYVPIGDASLISKRTDILLTTGCKLGDYIPFYFGIRMPMLYVIQKRFKQESPIAPEAIVYCVSNIEQIVQHQLKFIFTDGHAVNALTRFYNKSDLPQIEQLVDFKAIHAKYWKDVQDLDLKRRKEAEFLIADDIPFTALTGFVVYQESAALILSDLDIPQSNIAIKPNFYF